MRETHCFGRSRKAENIMKYMLLPIKNIFSTCITSALSNCHKTLEKSLYSFRFELTRQGDRVDSVQHIARLLLDYSLPSNQ